MEHIARISYGKDSLKMLHVIHSRGLPLDRITTTDVWATDTISANLPPVEAFKAEMDQRIWDMYRIEVEHLCARNPDGSKRTYEQMFYHVPKRRSQTVQVEREIPGGRSGSAPGTWSIMVSGVAQEASHPTHGGWMEQSRVFLRAQSGATGVKNSRTNGFPVQISPWCRKLKIFPFPTAPNRGARKEISWSI